jgi:hypothetical protein
MYFFPGTTNINALHVSIDTPTSYITFYHWHDGDARIILTCALMASPLPTTSLASSVLTITYPATIGVHHHHGFCHDRHSRQAPLCYSPSPDFNSPSNAGYRDNATASH